MRSRAFKGLKTRQVAKLGLALKFSILVKNCDLKTLALHAFLFTVLKFLSTLVLSEPSSLVFNLYPNCSGFYPDPSSSCFERFTAAGELFELPFAGCCCCLQLSRAVRFSTYTGVEVQVMYPFVVLRIKPWFSPYLRKMVLIMQWSILSMQFSWGFLSLGQCRKKFQICGLRGKDENTPLWNIQLRVCGENESKEFYQRTSYGLPSVSGSFSTY